MLQQTVTKNRNDGKLIRAVYDGNVRTVREELAKGDIDLQLRFGGKSFLRHAGERGHPLVTTYLLEYGADPNERQGATNYTLLHSAVASRNYGFARLLLEYGADASPRNSYLATPLHFASRMGQTYLVRQLLSHGADVDARDSQGRTPLFLAVQAGHSSTAKLLVAANADARLPICKVIPPAKVLESFRLELKEFSLHSIDCDEIRKL